MMREKAIVPPKGKTRVGISGSRSLTGREKAVIGCWLKGLEELQLAADPDLLIIIHGAAPGTDRIVAQWAVREGYELAAFPAAWRVYGPAAGPKRNALMVTRIDALVAVWDGQSPGTWDMIQRARERGLPVSVHRLSPLPGVGVGGRGWKGARDE
jgi:hypothetical protein